MRSGEKGLTDETHPYPLESSKYDRVMKIWSIDIPRFSYKKSNNYYEIVKIINKDQLPCTCLW